MQSTTNCRHRSSRLSTTQAVSDDSIRRGQEFFSHDIAGLVTMYGGANSHMAVRAAEFSLPAAIGVSESRYDQLSQTDVLEINCGAQDIREVQ